jgi:adenosylhomocysteine nucleosidase
MTRSGVGVVVALAAEAQALTPAKPRLGQIEDLGGGVRRHVCGMGPEAAAAAAIELVRSGVAALAMFGVAGALDPALASGLVLCPSEVLDDTGRSYACDGVWRSRLVIRLGSLIELRDAPLLTVREPLLTPEAKAEARRRSGAAAVDMESAAVAAVAQDAGLPFLAVRAIADGAADSLPPALTGAVDRWGRPRALGVAGALLRHPQLIARLPHLAATMNLAIAALRQVAQTAGPGLACSE